MVEVISQSLLFDIGVILIVASIVAYILRYFRQPLIPAYIIAGLILGPLGLKIIEDVDIIRNISEIGILFLLFIVGLEMDVKKLKKLGLVTIITGFFQVVLTFLIGFFVAQRLGFDSLNAVYAGLIIAFSSTMIVIKLLHDKDELNTLHGRIIIGILFVQDILVVLALTILMGTTTFTLVAIIPLLLKVTGLIIFAYLLNRFVMPAVFRVAANSSELLFLVAVATCFFFALGAYMLGFSVAIGGFIAGLTLASLPYNLNIIGHVSPLKDFFATIFFVSLGLQLTFVNFASVVKPLFIFLALVVLLKPFIVLLILSLLGYDKRNAFVSAVALAQISEFSLILVMSVGNVSQELFSLTILLGIISIGLTVYILKYEMYVYSFFAPMLALFEKLSKKHRELDYEVPDHKKIILFGCSRMGGTFLKSFQRVNKQALIIDFNPEVIDSLRKERVPCMYGDMGNKEILKRINFRHAKVVISTVASAEDNLRLLAYLKKVRSHATVFIAAQTLDESLTLYDAGADYVLLPTIMSGYMMANMLQKYMGNKAGLQKLKRDHLKRLLEMKTNG